MSQTLNNIFREIIFLKNNFVKNSLRRKTFYVKINGALDF